uniref:Uncharacterized protein n=1 Tax=Fagus sylvatica TaxID=28930 RepID=A0A2N9GII2_FAGSY
MDMLQADSLLLKEDWASEIVSFSRRENSFVRSPSDSLRAEPGSERLLLLKGASGRPALLVPSLFLSCEMPIIGRSFNLKELLRGTDLIVLCLVIMYFIVCAAAIGCWPMEGYSPELWTKKLPRDELLADIVQSSTPALVVWLQLRE